MNARNESVSPTASNDPSKGAIDAIASEKLDESNSMHLCKIGSLIV